MQRSCSLTVNLNTSRCAIVAQCSWDHGFTQGDKIGNALGTTASSHRMLATSSGIAGAAAHTPPASRKISYVLQGTCSPHFSEQKPIQEDAERSVCKCRSGFSAPPHPWQPNQFPNQIYPSIPKSAQSAKNHRVPNVCAPHSSVRPDPPAHPPRPTANFGRLAESIAS